MKTEKRARGIDWPCPQPDAIEGDGPIQYCSRCDAAVFDFSALSAEEAEALETANADRVFCARVGFEGARRRHRRTTGLRTIGLALGVGLSGIVLAQWAVGQGPESPGAGVIGPNALQGPEGLKKSVNAAIEAAARSTTPGPRPLTDAQAQPTGDLNKSDADAHRSAQASPTATKAHGAPPAAYFAAPGTFAPRPRPSQEAPVDR